MSKLDDAIQRWSREEAIAVDGFLNHLRQRIHRSTDLPLRPGVLGAEQAALTILEELRELKNPVCIERAGTTSLVVSKANPIGEETVCTRVIRIEQELPSVRDGDEPPEALYESEANAITLALLNSLPGATFDRLVSTLLEQRHSQLTVSHPSSRGQLESSLNAAAQIARLEDYLHKDRAHPDYEYATTKGPRKAFDGSEWPNHNGAWERNIHIGSNGWQRFEFHEEAHWMRKVCS